MAKQLIYTGFCIQIIKGQKCPKPAISVKGAFNYAPQFGWSVHLAQIFGTLAAGCYGNTGCGVFKWGIQN